MHINIPEWVGSLLLRRRQPDARGRTVQGRPFHAVTIVTANTCCKQAHELKGQRFLSAEAPRLPLQGCDEQQSCKCRYRHFVDRRNKLRRKADRGLPDGAWLKPERRSTTSRREDDL